MKKLMLFFAAMIMSVMTGFAKDVVFDILENPGQEYTKDDGTATTGDQSVTIDGVTIAAPATIWWNSDLTKAQYRIYKGTDLTITSTVGDIIKVVFECTAEGDAKYGPGSFNAWTSGDYTYEGAIGTWTGSAEEVAFTAGKNQVRATKITVTLGVKEYAALDRSGWSICAYADAGSDIEGANGGQAHDAIDDSRSTFFHSDWSGSQPGKGCPQGFLVDLGAVTDFDRLSVLPRQDADAGAPTEFRVYVYGEDNVPFTDFSEFTVDNKDSKFSVEELGEATLNGSWSDYSTGKEEQFANIKGHGRYVLFVADDTRKSDYNWLCVADFNLYKEVSSDSPEALANAMKEKLAEIEAAFTANSINKLITSEDQLSSPYTAGPDMEPGTSLGCLIDGDTSTYWHTDWSSEPAQHTHYLEVALAEAISGDFTAIMSRRIQAANDHVTQFCVHATNDAAAEEWAEIGTIDFPFTSQTDADLTATFNLPEAYQYLRFYWMESNGDKQRGYFHMSEFQLSAGDSFNDANPKAAAALVEALAAAKALTAPTQADIDALIAAYEAYLNGDEEEPEPVVFAPVEGQAYNIMFSETEGVDVENVSSGTDGCKTLVTCTATPSKVYFTQVGEGWTIKSGDKYIVSYSANGWSTGLSDEPYVWTIDGTNDSFVIIRQDGKNIKVENGKLYCDNTNESVTAHFHLVEASTEWNGEVVIADEVADLDDLLNFDVQFCEAGSVEVSGMGLLAAIFDESGDPFAIAMAGDSYNQFGSVEVKGDVATVKFQKIADIREELKQSAVAKIAGYNNGAAGFAYVYICGKSFKVDGTVYEEAIDNIYVASGSGEPTGINSTAIESKSAVYDLTGRRVSSTAKGQLYIQNGQKILK